METSWKTIYQGVVLGALSLTLMLGCQGNNRRGVAPIGGPIVGGPGIFDPFGGGAVCPTCNLNIPWTVFVGTNSQSGLGTVSLGLDFYGDPTLGYNFFDPKVPVMYTGPVVVRGLMQINATDTLTCSLPPGQYQIISLSPGQWQSGVVSSGYSGFGPTSLVMQAHSPQGLVVILRLAKGVIYNPNGTSSLVPNNLGGTLVFESVGFNGMPPQPCVTMSGQAAYAELF